MNTDEALDYAIEMWDRVNNNDPIAYDWKGPLRTLVLSGVFTIPQAAQILRINAQYAQRYIKQVEGPARKDRRSRGGVSGNISPGSLDKIKLLRALWTEREGDADGGRSRPVSDTERRLIADLVWDEGNGVRFLHHLTTVPVATLYRIRKEAIEG